MKRLALSLLAVLGLTTATSAPAGGILFAGADFGVVCDGATDNTTAMSAAFIAAGAMREPLFFQGGDCRYSIHQTIAAPGIVRGAGMGLTHLTVTTASENVLTITSGWVTVSDLDLLSTVPAASRTGNGVDISGQTNVLLERVLINGHQIGIHSSGSGNAFHDDSVAFNSADGILFDGTLVTPGQYEMEIDNTQTNSNGGSGLDIVGSAVGVYANRLTSVGNHLDGVRMTQGMVPHSSVLGPVLDVSFVNPEISGNRGMGINDLNNPVGIGLTVTGGLIESSPVLVWIGPNVRNSSITGTFMQDCQNCIIDQGSGTAVGPLPMRLCSTACIRVGVGSNKLVLVGITATDPVGSPVGVFADTGAGAISGAALDFTAMTPHNALPAGSVVSASQGF